MQKVAKPIKRSRLRQVVGKEYFVAKRKWQWHFGNTKYALQKTNAQMPSSVFKHRSLVLRPLKDVDMYLQENKRTNLALAINHINEIEIKPQETFSIWRLVGRPSARKGYLEGLVLNNGRMAKDIGGGLCQLGNLLFWIFAHSPLSIKERYRHGYDVFPDVKRKVPFGAGATLSYNYIDLQVKNETKHSFKICLWLDDTHLNGELYCDKVLEEKYTIEERNHLIKQQMWGGYTRHNQIVQVKTSETEITEKLLVENNAIMMYNPFLTQ